jgi:beta-1,4-mannosyl-glycoprotein beta-1,4-N-acetylglucosaminyltransferase
MIYDCFTFFNELDLLEIRLNHLYDHVDFFVLSEATLTHSGKPKPLFFEENQARYEKFLDKIIHIVVDDMPLDRMKERGDRWVLENYQRNTIKDGLRYIKDTDMVMISDLDEIPSIEAVGKHGVFIQIPYMYYLNVRAGGDWPGTVSMPYKEFRDKMGSMGQTVREQRNHYRTKIPNGGWHFGWTGGYDMVKYKLQSFAHSEFDNDTYYNGLEEDVRLVRPFFINGEKGSMPIVEIDESYPKYLLENLSKYQHMIYQQEKIDQGGSGLL